MPARLATEPDTIWTQLLGHEASAKANGRGEARNGRALAIASPPFGAPPLESHHDPIRRITNRGALGMLATNYQMQANASRMEH
ncbi:MAG: hypothetical protein AAF961_05435, partial [Planctomycetota bacterium]